MRLRYRHGDWAAFYFAETVFHSHESNGKIVFKELIDPKSDPSNPGGLWATGKHWRYVGPPLKKYGPTSEREKEAMVAIRKLGAYIEIDPRADEYCVESVDFPLGQTATEEVLTHAKHLTGLRGLSLDGDDITDAGLISIGKIASLEKLLLCDNATITDDGLANLRRLPHLRCLCLIRTEITDAGLEHIQGLTQLRELRLISTKVTDAGLVYLSGLKNLQTLDLAYTKVTDAGLAHLRSLTELRDLKLEGTKVTDAGIAQLSCLTKLKDLWLSSTTTWGNGIEELKKALPECWIHH